MYHWIIRALVFATAGMLSMHCGSAPKNTEQRGAERPPQEKEAAPPVEDSRPVIVALGDSLTAGLRVDPEHNYPSTLQRKVDAEGYRYRVINAGVSGDTSAQGLSRLGYVRGLHPEIVIVALGANDGLRGLPVESTYGNLEAIITQLKEDRIKILLAGMQMPPNYGREYTQAFSEVFSALAKKHRVSLVPFFLEGVGGILHLNQEDGVHPTAEGYSIIAENVWKILEPVLRGKR